MYQIKCFTGKRKLDQANKFLETVDDDDLESVIFGQKSIKIIYRTGGENHGTTNI